jgi:lipopolysaccharide export system protein LptA
VRFFFACLVFSADISAPKMEIVEEANKRLTVFPQGVEITDQGIKITGKYGIFYDQDNSARLYDSVSIINQSLTIHSETLLYDFNLKKAQLSGNVVCETDTFIIKAPLIIYSRITDNAQLPLDLEVNNKIHKILVTGKAGFYDFISDWGKIESLARLYVLRGETIIVNSNKMIFDNKTGKFWAIESVAVTFKDILVKCESLLYSVNDNQAQATNNPELLSNNNHLKGEKITFHFSDSLDALKMISAQGEVMVQYFTQDSGLIEIVSNKFFAYYQDTTLYEIQFLSENNNLVTGKFVPKEEL